MKFKLFLFGILLIGFSSFSQTQPFDIVLTPKTIPNLGGLQSFAFGQYNGEWLLVGGRLDGLHRRQPFASFDVAGNNNQLIVVNPVTNQTWSAPLSSLSIALQEQLSSTNMEFHQDGDYLYLVGGYGYNAQSASRLTFHNLTAITVSATINAIKNNVPFANYFRQITDDAFAVTGGHLKKINNTFYLIGGNRFDGNYNPMGNPTYTQVYTDAIRKFKVVDDGTTLSITHFPTITDATNLHRRDYNAVPQILPNGNEGVTVFSGVFQPTVNLPFLTSVDIDSLGHTLNTGFQQYYNHYHCAVLPLYAASSNEMHSVFFGGIAQYYENNGVLVQDNEVPFVKTIARVTRGASGTLAEYKLPIEMPMYLGAGSEFIPLKSIPHYENEVIKLDELNQDTTLVGYIFGGIASSAPNIFNSNTGTQSEASNQLFSVSIVKNALGLHDLNEQSVNSLGLQVNPNPSNGNFQVFFNLTAITPTTLTLYGVDGKIIEEITLTDLKVGPNVYQSVKSNREIGGTFFLKITTQFETAIQQLILK